MPHHMCTPFVLPFAHVLCLPLPSHPLRMLPSLGFHFSSSFLMQCFGFFFPLSLLHPHLPPPCTPIKFLLTSCHTHYSTSSPRPPIPRRQLAAPRPSPSPSPRHAHPAHIPAAWQSVTSHQLPSSPSSHYLLLLSLRLLSRVWAGEGGGGGVVFNVKDPLTQYPGCEWNPLLSFLARLHLP